MEDFLALKGEELDCFFLSRYPYLVGMDEVGRGPLAGPVVSCALVLKKNHHLKNLNDSKKLSLKQRLTLLPQILENTHFLGVGMAFSQEIDHINIYQATILSMKRALSHIKIPSGVLLIDGLSFSYPNFKSIKLIKGDQKSPSIMGAAIIAKIIRDRLMEYYHTLYPQYGFDKHKGYGTAFHLEALKKHGSCPLHRKSFSPIKEQVGFVGHKEKPLF